MSRPFLMRPFQLIQKTLILKPNIKIRMVMSFMLLQKLDALRSLSYCCLKDLTLIQGTGMVPLH